MIRSMTGFGKGETSFHHNTMVMEISTVNRKQLEIRVSLPREFSAFESVVRQEINSRLSRGSASARLTVSSEPGSALTQTRINWQLVEELADAAKEIKQRYQLNTMPTIGELLTIPGVVEAVSPDPDNPELLNAIKRVTVLAIENLLAMRAVEGESLRQDLENRLSLLKELLDILEPMTQEIPAQLKQKLLDKIAAENLPVDCQDERFLKEVLFYADKSDVSEELTRLKSHFDQFRKFLEAEEPSGRSLDFLMQEMFREITTLGNKAGSGQMTPFVVKFKAELEKLREQIQNVE